MLRMIKAELYKLFKGRTFKVLCIVAVLIVALNITLTMVMNEDFIESTGMTMEQYEAMKGKVSKDDNIVTPGQMGISTIGAENEFDVKPYEIFNISFGSGVIEILIAVLIGAMVAKEYSEGTIKNTLAYGKKRSHFYLSKYIANLIGITILMLIMTIGSTTILTLLKGWGKPFELSQLVSMVRTFLGAVIVYGGTLALVMFIATLVRSNGATIGIVIGGGVIIPSLIGAMYGKYTWFDKLYELTPYYNSLLVTSIKAQPSDIITAVIIGGVWLIVSLLAGIAIFNKQEIK